MYIYRWRQRDTHRERKAEQATAMCVHMNLNECHVLLNTWLLHRWVRCRLKGIKFYVSRSACDAYSLLK